MKLTVTLKGASPARDAAILNRATALLTAMEQEFANLKVEVSNAKARPQGAEAREDSKLADAGKGAAKEPKRGKAASD